MKEILEGQVEAINPIYTDEGANFTIIKRTDGDILIKKSTRSVLKDICKRYHYDLSSSNKTYGEMLGIKKTPPIPFTKELILMAVKTRIPIGKDDGAFSYVNIEKIQEVKNKTIYFKDGHSLKVLSVDKTILKNIKLAKLLKTKTIGDIALIRDEKNSYGISIEVTRI